MITIDPNRIVALRTIAGSKQATADKFAETAGKEAAEVEALRKEIQAASRRHERSGSGAEELKHLRSRQKAAQEQHSVAVERAEIAREDTRAARKLLSRCTAFLAGAGGENGV